MSEEQKSRETASQNEGPQEGAELKRADVERVEEAAQAIVRAIETGSDRFWEAQVEAQAKATKPKNPVVGSMLFVASTWVVFLAIFSGITILVGVVAYEVWPFHALERIGREQQQVQNQKNLSEFHADLGKSLLNVGQAKSAKAEFERALELDPFNRKAQMGTVKCELFEAVEAKAYDPAVIEAKLNKLVEERPNDTHVYAFRGTLRFLEYDYKRAEWNYNQAVKNNHSNAYAYDGLGLIHYENNRFDQALRYGKKAHEKAPWVPAFSYNYASYIFANEQYSEAIREYEEVRESDPEFMYTWNDLAQLYRLMGYLESSHLNYAQYIAYLEDEEIVSQDKNQATLTFRTDEDPVFLAEAPEKRYYAYYSSALTSYLRGRPTEVESYVDKANDVQISDYMKQEVNRLMKYDIELFQKVQKEQKQLSDKADSFRATFLS